MYKRVRFFEQDDKWYADVPGHSLEDNEMVMEQLEFITISLDGRRNVMVAD